MIDDCPICLVPHDDEIHTATLAIRAWHRQQVCPVPTEKPVKPPVAESWGKNSVKGGKAATRSKRGSTGA